MPRFRLEFEAGLDDGHGGMITACQVNRVIFAEKKKIAEEMGGTMLWEEVAQSEYLYKFIGVHKVPESVEYEPFWGLGSPGWANMILRMSLRLDDVDFVLEENKNRVFVVGFRLKKKKSKDKK